VYFLFSFLVFRLSFVKDEHPLRSSFVVARATTNDDDLASVVAPLFSEQLFFFFFARCWEVEMPVEN
jgi:hypothetical protein